MLNKHPYPCWSKGRKNTPVGEERDCLCRRIPRSGCGSSPVGGAPPSGPPGAPASTPQPGGRGQRCQGEACRGLCQWDTTGGCLTPASSCPNPQPWSDCSASPRQTPAEGCPPAYPPPTCPRSPKLSWPRGAKEMGQPCVWVLGRAQFRKERAGKG